MGTAIFSVLGPLKGLHSGPLTAAAAVVLMMIYTLASWIFLKHRRLAPTSRPLYMLSPLPGKLFTLIPTWLAHLILASAWGGLSREAWLALTTLLLLILAYHPTSEVHRIACL